MMLGAELLVNPVTAEGATAWSTYLPEGQWVDVWSGEEFAGGMLVERDTPIEIIPVYCRKAAWTRLAPVFADA